MQRIRIFYRKGDELRFTGNLDMHKVWERTFRRANLKLAYSQGFHPQPRIQQACPLPLGFIGSQEIIDFWLDSDEYLDSIKTILVNTLQPGITIFDCQDIPLNSPPMQTLTRASLYRISFDNPDQFKELPQVIKIFLNRTECLRFRRGKEYDLRKLVESLILISVEPPIIEVQMTTLPGATGRPEELLDELGIPMAEVQIERTCLIFDIPSG